MLTGTNPASPSSSNLPKVQGSAEAGSFIKLYASANCSGAPLAEGIASTLEAPGLDFPVSSNSTTAIRATARDAAGNTSACSDPLIYVEDSSPPARPSLTATSPASPADDNTPAVVGRAEDGSTVRIYTTADCTGAFVQATAALLESAGVEVSVADNTTTSFRATATDAAGNRSACSDPIAYVEDSTGPSAPTLTATSPDSPANDNSPRVEGIAEAGTTVRLYTTDDCSGPAVATGSAVLFGAPGLLATAPDDSTTAFRATATDSAGNSSACSDPIAYVEDSTGPAAPAVAGTDPSGSGTDATPLVMGSAEPGSTVRVYTDPDCAHPASGNGTGSADDFAAGIEVTVPAGSTTTFHARATDPAGNGSPCSASSATYSHDVAPPATPVIAGSSPRSPSNVDSPMIAGTTEAGTTVRLYTTDDCSGPAAATGSAADFASPGLAVTVAPDTATSFRAAATDVAGNASACSDRFTYIEDSTAPDAPSLASTDPASPSSSNSPAVRGSAEPGSLVKLYATADCSGTPVAEGTAATFEEAGLEVPVPADAATSIRATARDGAGNVSGCSGALVYVEDSTPPAAPELVATLPASGSDDNAPLVRGSAEDDSVVRLYAGTDCSGAAVATGTAAELAGAGLPVSVAENSTTTFRATATDAAGNTSECSAPLVYVEVTGGGFGADDGDNRLVGTPFDDTICGLLGDDTIRGRAGDDTLFGDACGATSPSGGGDRIYGGAGRDRIYGGAGDDDVDARDREQDVIDCGPGDRDSAKVDQADIVEGCEKVKRARR